MRQIFDKIKAKCTVCGTPLNGYDLFKIGDYYYCGVHYEKEKEKPVNERIRKDNEFLRKILTND